MSPSPEKRRHPRKEQRLELRVTDDGGAALETINLSCGGILCSSAAWVAPMTRMAVSLRLPLAPPSQAAVVRGEAVVVRTEPAAQSSPKGGYHIALFFSRMDEEHRQALQQFLESR